MDRNIVYPGSIPLDTDILYPNRSAMVGIAALTAATLGSAIVVDGLACTPTSPASLTVNVGPGSITQLSSLDASAYGSLAADVTDQIVKTGINLQATSFTLTMPVSSGQAINYLIEAAFSEVDSNAVVLPYVNAANPSLPYSGPDNAGTAQNTQRIQRVQLQLKPGVAASAGTQTTPAVDSGWVGLYVIAVNYGQSVITSAQINVAPGAPFLSYKLPSLRPGFATMAVFNASGTFTVPNGVTSARVTVIGGGGGRVSQLDAERGGRSWGACRWRRQQSYAGAGDCCDCRNWRCGSCCADPGECRGYVELWDVYVGEWRQWRRRRDDIDFCQCGWFRGR